MPVPRDPGNRFFLLAGIGAEAIGAVAIIAILISGSSSASNLGGNTTLPTQTRHSL